MTDGLLKKLERGVPARPVRQSLRQFGNLHLHHRPERAGQAGFGRQGRHQPANQGRQAERRLRRPTLAASDEEGEIIALLAGDEVLRGLLAAARRRREIAAGWLVFHRRHRFRRSRRRSVRHRPRRRHDHHRRRERLAGRDRKLPVAASGRARSRRRRPRRREVGQGRHRLCQAQGAGQRAGSRSVLPHVRACRTSSARGASSLSMPCRNPRSENCCAACSSRATISANTRRPRARPDNTRKEMTMAAPYTFTDPRLAKLDGFQVEIDEAHERADIILNRPPLQRRLDAAARPASAGVRDARRGCARARHRRALGRRAFLQRRQYRRLHGSLAGDRSPSSPGTSPRRRAARSR